MNSTTTFRLALLLSLIFIFFGGVIMAQTKANEVIQVQPVSVETVESIMARQALAPPQIVRLMPEHEGRDAADLKQNPLSKPIASFPEAASNQRNSSKPTPTINIAQTQGLTFNSVTGPTETGSFPPDVMGAVGPTQFITFVNGRLRSFNKTTGVADGVLNADPKVFFNSVMTTPTSSNFTSDPRIRYDRISARWLLIIIDVPGGSGALANRCLLAVSNSSTITVATTWTFTQFLGQTGKFFDYPTLGIDANAAYIGGNMFTLAGAFSGTNGYVINRTNLMAGGAYTVYSFFNLATASVAGPYTPQGVDNFDLTATQGYFIGPDVLSYGLLQIIRVSTPAAVPTISGNLSVTVPTTTNPLTIPHLGNTGGVNGNLDGLDDRLFAAVIRNGHLWTAHNIGVNSAGVASSPTRNGSRWYDLTNLTSVPTLTQSGTVFDNAATNPRFYNIPSIMVSGQNHAAMSLTTGGLADRANVATAGRLTGDVLGSMQAPMLTTSSSTAYNPTGDPGPTRRWGDYSYVSLDPLDDMTMWITNEWCNATNTYGVSVSKLLAPLPATPASCNPTGVNQGLASVNVIVTANSVSGSGFYDPGSNLAAPAIAFNHISATVTGGVVVNSVTYTDPTHVTLNLNTVAASGGNQTFTITNPDGQVINSGAVVLPIRASNPTDYYRSITSGNWNAINTWESSTVADFSSGVVSPATLTPAVSAARVEVRNSHTITVTANVISRNVVCLTGSNIITNSGFTLTVQ